MGEAFKAIDVNKDGVVSKEEFLEWVGKHHQGSATASTLKRSVTNINNIATAPTNSQLAKLALRSGFPFLGFGIADNLFMLTFGDLIESNFGATLMLSTMAAAALGNTISDILGIGLSGFISQFADKLGFPSPNLSEAQSNMTITKVVAIGASCVFITVGCLIGMTPLLFMEKHQYKKDGEKVAVEA